VIPIVKVTVETMDVEIKMTQDQLLCKVAELEAKNEDLQIKLSNLEFSSLKLKKDIQALELMCLQAGYDKEQVKFRTPYIESMGT
jgi:hypothetical protein